MRKIDFNDNETWFEHTMADGSKYYDHNPFGPDLDESDKPFAVIGMFVSDWIALFIGCVASDVYVNLDSRDGQWFFFSFILAIGVGLFFRYIFKDAFGGHLGITKASIISALIVTIISLFFIDLIGELTSGPIIIAYLVLFTYAICL